MVMDMICIEMGRDQHLIVLAPDPLCELDSDPVSKLWADLALLKALVSVICDDAAFFSELFLHGHELVSCDLRTAVDPGDKELLLRLIFICSIMHHICECRKLFSVPLRIGCLHLIRHIGKRAVRLSPHRPDLCHSHLAIPSSGVRNRLSISA